MFDEGFFLATSSLLTFFQPPRVGGATIPSNLSLVGIHRNECSGCHGFTQSLKRYKQDRVGGACTRSHWHCLLPDYTRVFVSELPIRLRPESWLVVGIFVTCSFSSRI
ncbi:hypothetical protein C8R47DRAFT_1155853 [Mycena vitilis]|nr:hypothetical protein C8R47DRAFT_1155853 [Mycena vitilis]